MAGSLHEVVMLAPGRCTVARRCARPTSTFG